MAVEETWRSDKYDPYQLDGRYVRRTQDGAWEWIECQTIGKWRYDVRKGTLKPSDLPVHIMDAALDRCIARTWPTWTEWPA